MPTIMPPGNHKLDIRYSVDGETFSGEYTLIVDGEEVAHRKLSAEERRSFWMDLEDTGIEPFAQALFPDYFNPPPPVDEWEAPLNGKPEEE